MFNLRYTCALLRDSFSLGRSHAAQTTRMMRRRPRPSRRPRARPPPMMPPPEVKSGRMYKGWVFRVPRVDFVRPSPSLSLPP